jgi:hypothetical protein
VTVTAQRVTPVAAPQQPLSAKKSASQVEDPQDDTQTDATGTDTILGAEADESDQPQPTSTVIQTAAASVSASSYLWWVGVAALALAAGAAILAAGYFKRGEWDIVEDKDD